MKWPFVLRSTYDALSAALEMKISCLESTVSEQERTIKSLNEQLEKALKNDKRDPATGKYTK